MLTTVAARDLVTAGDKPHYQCPKQKGKCVGTRNSEVREDVRWIQEQLDLGVERMSSGPTPLLVSGPCHRVGPGVPTCRLPLGTSPSFPTVLRSPAVGPGPALTHTPPLKHGWDQGAAAPSALAWTWRHPGLFLKQQGRRQTSSHMPLVLSWTWEGPRPVSQGSREVAAPPSCSLSGPRYGAAQPCHHDALRVLQRLPG